MSGFAIVEDEPTEGLVELSNGGEFRYEHTLEDGAERMGFTRA